MGGYFIYGYFSGGFFDGSVFGYCGRFYVICGCFKGSFCFGSFVGGEYVFVLLMFFNLL